MEASIARQLIIAFHTRARCTLNSYGYFCEIRSAGLCGRLLRAIRIFGRRRNARLLLDRARDLIIHGSAHRGANGVAMPTDEDDQDGNFFYNHPERGAYSAA